MEIYKKQTLAETFSVYFDSQNDKDIIARCNKWFSLGNYWKLPKSLVKRRWFKSKHYRLGWINFCSLCFQLFMGSPIIDRVKDSLANK